MVRVVRPRGHGAAAVEWHVSMVALFAAVGSACVAAYYFSLSICPPVSTTTGLGCYFRAASALPRGELWTMLAAIFAFLSSVTYPMARFGGASFLRGRLFQPGSLEGTAGPPWTSRLFLVALMLSYAALQLIEFLLVPAGGSPYSDPQAYYIPAALDILAGNRCTTSPVESTCNYEHPPLDKLFLALSIRTFGKNLVGYSLFPVLFGAGSLLLTYGIAKEVSGQKVAQYAAFFLLIDGVFLGMNEQAWTDTPMFFFGLFAVYVYLSAFRSRPAVKAMVAGSLIGLSILSKETGLLFVIAILAYSFLARHDLSMKRALLLLGAAALVAAVGLELYDVVLTPFPSFIAHIQYILAYNHEIGLSGWAQESWLPFLGGTVIPMAWFLFYPPFGFISTMPEEWLFLASVVVAVYLLARKWESLSPPEGNTILFVFVWMGATWAPFVFAQLFRSTYPFYMLGMLPGVVIADGWIMTKLTRPMKVVFVIACLAWLAVLFPMTSTAIPLLPYIGRWLHCISSACPGGP